MRLRSLALVSSLLSAVPVLLASPSHQAPFLSNHDGQTSATHSQDQPNTADESNPEMVALLDKFAPIFKLHESELYYPSSVQFMLDYYKYVARANGTWFEPEPGTFSMDKVQNLPRNGKKLLLSVDVPINAQPEFKNKESQFMYGPGGLDGGMEYGDDGRGRVYDEVYGFWVDQGRGVVDLWYWTFYPYNLGKTVGTLGTLGNHVTDWEHLRIRTVNGTGVSADFDTHSGGPFSAGTYRYEEIEQYNGRPVAYVAYGSHGVWPNAGKHVYAQLLNLWELVDVTDDKGALWDTRGHVFPIQYWTGPDDAKKIVHTGDHGWLDFKGQWGNLGSTSCWWHMFVGICQVIDGPPGPNRNFGKPPDCIIGEAAEQVSHYSFYVSRNVSDQVDELNVTTIVVEQICARPNVANVAGGDTDLDSDPSPSLSITSETIPHRRGTLHRASLQECHGTRSSAKAYRLALYNEQGEHVSTSPLRVICLTAPGHPGFVSSSALTLDDLDEWRWRLVVPPPGKHGDDDDDDDDDDAGDDEDEDAAINAPPEWDETERAHWATPLRPDQDELGDVPRRRDLLLPRSPRTLAGVRAVRAVKPARRGRGRAGK